MTTFDVFQAMSEAHSRKNLAKLLSEGKNADFENIKASLDAGKKLETEAFQVSFDLGKNQDPGWKEARDKWRVLSNLYHYLDGVMVYAFDFEDAPIINIAEAIPIWEIPTTERMDMLLDLAIQAKDCKNSKPKLVELGCGAALWTAMLRRRVKVRNLDIDVIATNQECKQYLQSDFVQVDDIQVFDWKDAVKKYKAPGVTFFFSWCAKDMDPTPFLASEQVDLFVLIGKMSCCAYQPRHGDPKLKVPKNSYEHADYVGKQMDVPGICAYGEETQFFVMKTKRSKLVKINSLYS